jgi:hypothetical protein
MGFALRLLVALFMVTASMAQGAAEPAPTGLQIGVGLTPAHFPRQTGVEVEGMFRQAASVGRAGVILGRWDDPGFARVDEQMSMLADREGLTTIVQLDIFEPGGTRLAPPPGVSRSGFGREAAEALALTLTAAAAQHPAYIIAATDANRLLASGTDRLAEFAQSYKQAYHAAKKTAPDTRIAVSFNLEIFRRVHEQGGVSYAEVRKLVDLFRPELDFLAFSSMPSDVVRVPATVPADYFDVITALRDREDVVLVTGWPSDAGGEGAQTAFARRLPELTARIKPALVLWPLLHDLPVGGAPGSLGLFAADDREKPVAAELRTLSGRTVTAAAPVVPASVIAAQTEAPRRSTNDKFTIAVSTLGGAPPRILASDPHREINHARISPDGSEFVFTRYNRFDHNGDALEIDGYLQTEIVVCRLDGASCKTVIPARRGIVAANGNWTPDGRHILFVSSDTPNREAGLASLDIASGRVTMLNVGIALEFADPHQVGQEIVAPGKEKAIATRISRLFLFSLPDMTPRELTHPQFKEATEMDPPLGDHDPKLSPDRRYVAVMRHLARDDWAIIVVDTATGAERNLSDVHPVDAVPEWSSDSRLLIFWHVERGDLMKSGIYTMEKDGSGRARVPLPPGYFYTMPAFFPNSGSGSDAGIIYSARPDSRM